MSCPLPSVKQSLIRSDTAAFCHTADSGYLVSLCPKIKLSNVLPIAESFQVGLCRVLPMEVLPKVAAKEHF